MQTFLPFPDIQRSLDVLDERRLGKQRVEALQILRAVTWTRYGWQHHPVVRMWRQHPRVLAAYGLEASRVWVARGHPDSCAATITTDLVEAGLGLPPSPEDLSSEQMPAWWADERLHRSHRSALLRKDREHYRVLFPDDPDDLPYWWPV